MVDRYDVAAGGEAVVPVEGAGCVVGLRGGAVVKCEGCEDVELPAGRAVVVAGGVRGGSGAEFSGGELCELLGAISENKQQRNAESFATLRMTAEQATAKTWGIRYG